MEKMEQLYAERIAEIINLLKQEKLPEYNTLAGMMQVKASNQSRYIAIAITDLEKIESWVRDRIDPLLSDQ